MNSYNVYFRRLDADEGDRIEVLVRGADWTPPAWASRPDRVVLAASLDAFLDHVAAVAHDDWPGHWDRDRLSRARWTIDGDGERWHVTVGPW